MCQNGNKRKVVKTEGITLPEGNIADVVDSYKYLGILQANGNQEAVASKGAIVKHLQSVTQVLKSQLNGKHKMQAINSCTLPVIRYPAGIITWLKKDLDTTDIKTRKPLTMQGGFHPKSRVQRLYTKRSDGDIGLVSFRATIQAGSNQWFWVCFHLEIFSFTFFFTRMPRMVGL